MSKKVIRLNEIQVKRLIRKIIKEAVNIERFGGLNPRDPEFASIESFADWLSDNDRSEYTHHELMCLNNRTGIVTQTIKDTLAFYGFTLKHRDFEKQVRGFTANPNAGRFDGMHGGSGGDSITGFAGNAAAPTGARRNAFFANSDD